MDSKKKIVIILLPLGVLIHLIAAIVYGRRENWFEFGLYLTGCVVIIMLFIGILLACKIDSRFNQLEKTIREGQQISKDEKIIEQRSDKPT